MSDFMQPEVDFFSAYLVETDHGSELVPSDLVGDLGIDGLTDTEDMDPDCLDSFRDYIEGSEIYSVEPITGWFARLSAPGYLDCTEWLGPFDTEQEALKDLDDTYGIDAE